jgi:hypothetical protein
MERQYLTIISRITKMRFLSIVCFVFLFCNLDLVAQQTETQYLSGTDKDHTVDWDFYCTGGRNSGKWTKIPVPSNWELKGFGTYNYGKEKNKSDEKGLYKYQFEVKTEWKKKRVFIVFEGSMTDTKVKINGKLAGPIHQGAFYRFKYEIGKHLNFKGKNLLEVEVAKKSADTSVNRAERDADFWVFGGIFRPVYLEAVPEVFIEQISIDADHNGKFKALIEIDKKEKVDSIIGWIMDRNSRGNWCGTHISKTGNRKPALVWDPSCNEMRATRISENRWLLERKHKFQPLYPWTPELPELYQFKVQVKSKSGKIHEVKKQFGFRTVGFREKDGFYLNGTKVKFKGVNRHTFWPDAGRCSSKERSIADVLLMKSMNMNAVRMSHYPPDQHFLDVCDSLGLFVLDELAGWQKHYDTEVGKKLVKEMVLRDVNHPSILAWDNGNEGGFNFDLDNEFAKYDPQNRIVLHPWALHNGVDTQHYKEFGCCIGSHMNGPNVWMPTEFLHVLYDGCHGAGLEDYWIKMWNDPLCAGGFLWDLADEGVVRRDKHDSIDVKLDQAPDGIVGPYHEKEASFYTIRDIWSPVHVLGIPPSISENWNGLFKIENRNFFKELSDYQWKWTLRKLKTNHTTGSDSVMENINRYNGKPQDVTKWNLSMQLLEGLKLADYLQLEVMDERGNMVHSKTWPISRKKEPWNPKRVDKNPFEISSDSNLLIIKAKSLQFKFTKKEPILLSWNQNGKTIPLNQGPAMASGKSKVKSFSSEWKPEKGCYELNWKGAGSLRNQTIEVYPDGKIYFDVAYQLEGTHPFAGVTFDWKPEKIDSVEWVGNGPYRVWQNRRRGMNFGYWKKAYNETQTGLSWNYPEWAGYHEDVRWCRFKTSAGNLLLVMEDPDLFIRWGTPKWPEKAWGHAHKPPFPTGDLSILHSIPPIGNKFHPAEGTGPQGQQSFMSKYSHSEQPRLRFWMRVE